MTESTVTLVCGCVVTRKVETTKFDGGGSVTVYPAGPVRVHVACEEHEVNLKVWGA